MVDITAEDLKRRFSFDPATGLFVRLMSLGGKGREGKIAGSLCEDGYIRISVKSKMYIACRRTVVW